MRREHDHIECNTLKFCPKSHPQDYGRVDYATGAKRGGPPQLPPLVGQPVWTQKCGWWLDNSESDFCYLMIRQPTKTWEKAQDDCQRLQGNLLSITDDHEQTFVRGYIKGLTNASSLWLGANVAISDEGSTWADGASFTYVHSTSGTPDGNCLSFLTGNGNWHYDSCNKERGYVCKKRGNVKPTPAPDCKSPSTASKTMTLESHHANQQILCFFREDECSGILSKCKRLLMPLG
ncbi:alpha-N-acetylgalactosamine-specific lectin-like [Syngnathus acus]|uniref:alpha-N-acetylgalactosamine-specific lectin-like n=1 Tax=Syngnathus acus TaxID=161584 RepID=UPI001885DAF7|nr:alpha-N-acetylgalactosamine-specific lectin-like [Syngnathus acus]